MAILADKDFFEYDIDMARIEIVDILSVLKKNYRSQRIKEIQKLLDNAEKQQNVNEVNGLMEELRILLADD